VFPALTRSTRKGKGGLSSFRKKGEDPATRFFEKSIAFTVGVTEVSVHLRGSDQQTDSWGLTGPKSCNVIAAPGSARATAAMNIDRSLTQRGNEMFRMKRMAAMASCSVVCVLLLATVALGQPYFPTNLCECG